MRYKIKDIPSEGLVCDQALPDSLLKDALEGTGADLGASAAAVKLELTRTGQDVYVRGSLKATASLPCGACLKPARVTLEAPIKIVYVPEGEEARENEDPLDEGDFATHDGEYVELDEVVREQLILGLPISPRCKEDCRGLCAVCGQDRNEHDCGHEQAPRFSAFREQLEKVKG